MRLGVRRHDLTSEEEKRRAQERLNELQRRVRLLETEQNLWDRRTGRSGRGFSLSENPQ